MKHLYIFLVGALLAFNSFAQNTLSGNLSLLKGQTIRLVGFNGLGIYNIDSTQINEQGTFSLQFSDADLGMGYIAAADNKPYFVVLAKEQIELKGETLTATETVITIKGNENKLFVNYAKEHAKREQALSAWDYLQKIYQGDAVFSSQKTTQQSIATEMQRIKKQDLDFLSGLPATAYVKWYLPLRKLISSVSSIAQYKTAEIPATISAFRKIDYADPRLYKSGLLRDAIESQYWLLENRGLPLDTIFKDMNVSTDFLLKRIGTNEKLFNEISKYLYDYFEKHSLFQPSEYLAVKALTQNSCTLNNDLAKQMESYRAMKIGNIAPDILFAGDVYQNGSPIISPSRLSAIVSNYKLVIFGASWCPSCTEEIAQLLPLYGKLKSKGIEVVFISLDTDKKAFQDFTSVLPFISSCDYKKWDTPAAKDFYVFASPSIFLLDNDGKIKFRPKSIAHLTALINSL